MDDVIQGIVQAGMMTLFSLASFVLPVAVLCLLLLLLSRSMNRRLWKTFGFKGVLALAWLGTPVHELSHLFACKIALNRVEDFSLFKPNPKTGSLGYVRHSYERRSFYPHYIGAPLIGLAPFFGGSAAIYLLTAWLFPDLLHSARLPEAPDGGWMTLAGFWEYSLALWAHLTTFASILFSASNVADGRFWLYLFAMVSLAAHLSPSRSDFTGLFRPMLLILVLVYLAHLLWLVFSPSGSGLSDGLTLLFAGLNALLLLALLFLLVGAAFTLLLTLVWNWVRG